MTTTCINLKERFGDVYKVHLNRDEYMAEPEKNRIAEKPWHYELLCQNGHIYPHGGELLGVATRSRGPTANALSKLPCIEVTQDGEDGINATFHVDDFEQVAAIVKPRKRRRLSPEHRKKLIEASKSFRFTGTGGSEIAQESTISP